MPRTAGLAALLVAASALLLAQTAPTSALPPLAAVAVTGSARFGQDPLVAASGLHLGESMSLAVLNQAAKRLAATGVFARVNYRYTYSQAGTDVQFQVTDASDLLPVQFDNFVWVPQPQLLALLRSKVPLFTGKVPESGSVDQQVTAALQAILMQHGVSGATVQGIPFQNRIGSGGINGYRFYVQGVKIPVQQIAIVGAPAALEPKLQKEVASLLRGDFSQSQFAVVIRLTLLPELQDRGLLQARFAPPAVQLAGSGGNAVRVRLTVNPGPEYRWGAIVCQGNSAFDTKLIMKLVKVHAGSVADEARLDQDLATIRKLYGSRGYLEAAVAPRFDFSQPGVAALTFAITEGPEYRMGTLSFNGVSEAVAKQLSRLWSLARGQPYDTTYMRQYIGSLSRHFNLGNVGLQTKIIPDRKLHTVNVAITLSKSDTGS